MRLVVGATGQVGSEVVRQLSARGERVRIFIRPDSNHAHLLALPGVEVVHGDLLDPATLPAALAGVEHVIATANSVAPRKRRDVGRVETVGYPNLARAAGDAGVTRIVYLSTVSIDPAMPLERNNRVAEEALRTSGIDFAILRFTAFTDVWLALPGSAIPTRGGFPTIFDRPFWFLRAFRRATGATIEKRGRMSVNGSADRRNSFITVHDVAALLIAATDHDRARNATLDIGGPEALTWHDVAALYQDALGRDIRISVAPAGVFAVMQTILRPFSPAAASVMALNRASARTDADVIGTEIAAELGVGPLQRAETFLKEKLTLDS